MKIIVNKDKLGFMILKINFLASCMAKIATDNPRLIREAALTSVRAINLISRQQ